MKMKWSSALLATVTGLAHAQSSVMLYGIVDTGVSYYNHATPNGGSSVGMPFLTGELPSRWGLKGAEDLGAGYKTFFVLESVFQPGTGSLSLGGRIFGRQANVGVSSPYGVVGGVKPLKDGVARLSKALNNKGAVWPPRG